MRDLCDDPVSNDRDTGIFPKLTRGTPREEISLLAAVVPCTIHR